MKRIILFFISLFFFNCTAQKDITSDKRLIEDFVEDVLLSGTSKNKDLEHYLNIYNVNEFEKKRQLEVINYSILGTQETIKSFSDINFKIYNYKEAIKYSNMQSSISFKNIEYNDLKDVYFVIFDNNTDQVFTYVVDDDKIISFFSKYIRFNKETDPMVPYMLNEKPEQLKAVNKKLKE